MSTPPISGTDPAAEIAHGLVAELTSPVPPEISAMAAAIVGEARPLGVLFYGSVARALAGTVQARAGETLCTGMLDFYVIVRRQKDWPRRLSSRIANILLPPNVEYHEVREGERILRAKVAVLTLSQFRRLTRPDALDSSVWARFSQPARLIWVRDTQAADSLLRCIVRAVAAAAHWSARLGPESGPSRIFWAELYARTYRNELRVEAPGRERLLLSGMTERNDVMLRAAWSLEGILSDPHAGEMLRPALTNAARRRALSSWQLRCRLGRPLNLLRLVKASFTFTGGARYLAWKIERHTGISMPLTPFAEKYPLLAAPRMAWRLIRSGLLCQRQA
ncbi:hypothetical protein LOC54_03830 [Acetobacter sp. AN02]|uniref:hypothetical protein n=1 Tax=Acetobacter sp. AN02 TaxID=2894186 RepID=UPI0024343B7C|nr:hypothetical protein [Acetobacter sp. AN02]MDG6094249.1 hypothetical protein [Acetobacter sp. AN02]